MKNILILILGLTIIITGCSNTERQNEKFIIYGFFTSMGGDLNETRITYTLSISYSDGIEINEGSIEPIFSDWVQERMVRQEIVGVKRNTDEKYVEIEGKVFVNTEGLSKQNMDEEEKLIQGATLETMNGDKYKIIYKGSTTEVIKVEQ